MRRLPLVFAAFAPLALGGAVAAQRSPRRPATITITASGADMEFRTLGLGEFTVADGTSTTFTVKPGDYTITQAPPVGVATQVAPNEFVIVSGVLTECSDGEQRVHRVRRGNALRCTFTT